MLDLNILLKGLKYTKKCMRIKKDCFCTARHFNNKCCDLHDPRKYLAVEIIEAIRTNDDKDFIMYHSFLVTHMV